MTKKDYALVAAVFANIAEENIFTDTERAMTKLIVNRLALKFDLNNKRFNRELFLKACSNE